MKRPFSRRRNQYGSAGTGGSRAFWVSGVVIVIVIILFGLRFLFPNFFAAFEASLWQEGTSLSGNIDAITADFQNKARLSAENAALAEQVRTLTNENQVLTARSQDLTKLLGNSSIAGNKLLAGVLARPPESPYDTLTVAAGSSDGIAIEALVYSAGGIPVGTIQSISKNTSSVLLFSTSGRNTSGWIGQNRIPVTLTGAGAGAFSATIPQTSSVAVGDTVYVPGPGALPIGTIVKIDTDPSSPTAILHIQPLVNLFSIAWVEVARS